MPPSEPLDEAAGAGEAPSRTRPGTAVTIISSILLPLALAQFIASYAGSSMNVAISSIAQDLETTTHGVQLAITLFTLTMAALMIPGSKVTDIWGRRRCFILGLVIYGLGALLASIAQGLALLIVAYSLPDGYVCSGSLKRSMGTTDVRDVIDGKKPLQKLFSKEQRSFYAAHAPHGLELDDLSILGPILVLKLKFAPEGYDRKLVAELWFYPDNSMLLELSTKCAPGEAFQVAAVTRSFLTQHDVDLSGAQETKTKKALQFFSKQLEAMSA